MGRSCGKKVDMKNWQREQMPRKWRGNGGEKEQIYDGDCIKSDHLARVREEWEKAQIEGIGGC